MTMTLIKHAMIAASLAAASLAPTIGAAQTARTSAQAAVNAPVGSEAWLRMRGETYSRAPDSKQNPTELVETARLNAAIAAGNNAATATERSNAASVAASAEARAEYREDLARAALERAEYLEAKAANEAERAEAARARATWEGMIRACERSGRTDCRVNQRPVG